MKWNTLFWESVFIGIYILLHNHNHWAGRHYLTLICTKLWNSKSDTQFTNPQIFCFRNRLAKNYSEYNFNFIMGHCQNISYLFSAWGFATSHDVETQWGFTFQTNDPKHTPFDFRKILVTLLHFSEYSRHLVEIKPS